MPDRYTMFFCFFLAAIFGVRMSAGETHFCDKTEYKTNEQICCDSKLYDRNQDGHVIECCEASGTTYKHESEICCGKVFYKTEFAKHNLSCCYGKPYQEGKDLCLDGEIIAEEDDTKIDRIKHQVQKIDEVQNLLPH